MFTKHILRIIFLLILGFRSITPVWALTVTVSAIDRGYWDDDGWSSNPGGIANDPNDYHVGYTSHGKQNNYVVFDLSNFSGWEVISATVSYYQNSHGKYWYGADDLTLYDVSTDYDLLRTGGLYGWNQDGPTYYWDASGWNVQVFTDLQQGQMLGTTQVFNTYPNAQWIRVELNSSGISDLTSHLGSLYAIGGTCNSCAPNSTGQGVEDYLLGFSSLDGHATLTLELKEIPPVSNPAAEIRNLTNGSTADAPNDADVPRIAYGDVVTWTYEVENTGDVAFAAGEVQVSDDQLGVTPVLDVNSDNGDMILSPGEVWRYAAVGQALDLDNPPADVTIVSGCNNDRNTYQNVGRLTIAGTDIFSENMSHYCNPDSYDVDSDGDGNFDQFDNCTLVSNPSQIDTDGDGYGNYCDPDFNNDLIINFSDLAYMKSNFFSADPHADLSGDGIVNFADLAIIKQMFFKPPGPSGLAP
jgi:hypothetical protein